MTDEKRIKIFVGIPCYGEVAPEVLQDYFRLAYYFGRRYTEYDFFLGIKTKTEQFRARNAIVEAAYQVSADYLLMIDDDHIFDVDEVHEASNRYDFLRKLIAHDKDVIGALYYQRGGGCHPVVMSEAGNGYRFLRDDEIIHDLQRVDVTGGGCMLIKMKVFDKISNPWFEPEKEFGTDVQICQKAKRAGFEIWCDTSIEIGHVIMQRNLVTGKTRHLFARIEDNKPESMSASRELAKILEEYRKDAMEYLNLKNLSEVQDLAVTYGAHRQRFPEFLDKAQYYCDAGPSYLARQIIIHGPSIENKFCQWIFKTIRRDLPGHGFDFGCGSAPLTFEYARSGHVMHFVDIDGAAPYEFLKWRAKKCGLNGSYVRFNWPDAGTCDYVIMLDSLEHLQNWKEVILRVKSVIKPFGALLTNFMLNEDRNNPEHIFMDKPEFMKYMVQIGMYPVSPIFFQRREDTL